VTTTRPLFFSEHLPATVLLVEVGPRDGLQNESGVISTETKIWLINALSRTGVGRIEATSFVSPRAVPQLADADAVMSGITRLPTVEYAALIPNERGLERAAAAGIDIVNIVVVATETFNRRNVNMSVAESMGAAASIAKQAEAMGIRVSAVVAASFYCPFEGPVSPEQVVRLASGLADMGIAEVTLADTIGAAGPAAVADLVTVIREQLPSLSLGLHLHDTRGQALPNALAGVLAGVTRLEASVGGLGGCPFAPRATGNACSEDLVFMLESIGIRTGVNLESLLDASRLAQSAVDHRLPSRLLEAGLPGYSSNV